MMLRKTKIRLRAAEIREDILLAERKRLVALLDDLTDRDDCWFDHNGGCQAHGYLSLKPGELCPQYEAKQVLIAYGFDQ